MNVYTHTNIYSASQDIDGIGKIFFTFFKLLKMDTTRLENFEAFSKALLPIFIVNCKDKHLLRKILPPKIVPKFSAYESQIF